MRIWICDDNNEAISSLSEIIEEIGSHPLETFVDPVHMLKALKTVMPQMFQRLFSGY